MKSNRDMEFDGIGTHVGVHGGEYMIGKRGKIYRGYGYQWWSEQDASREFMHHEVAVRGSSLHQAVERLESAIVISGAAGLEGGCSGLDVGGAALVTQELTTKFVDLFEVCELFDITDEMVEDMAEETAARRLA